MSEKNTNGLGMGSLSVGGDEDEDPITKAIRQASGGGINGAALPGGTAGSAPMSMTGQPEVGGMEKALPLQGSGSAAPPGGDMIPAVPGGGSAPSVPGAAPGLMSDLGDPSVGAPKAATAPDAGYVSFNGFDGSKFGKDSKPGSKYTPDAAVYSQAIGSGVDFGRGNMGPLADFYHTKGYPDATAVGDDKIDPDGPGPMAPIDAIRGGDNAKVYQNTTGNPQWEAQYGKGGGAGSGASADPMAAAHAQNPMLAQLLGGPMNSGLQSADFFKQLMERGQKMAGPAATNQAALLSMMDNGAQSA